MNRKTLNILIAAAVVLGVLYFLAVPSSEPSRSSTDHRLFSGVDGSKVATIRLEQGNEAVELAVKDGAWVLPARNGYPADSAKVRALLLKLFDLSVSQKVPGGPESHEQLGVSEESLKRGMGHVGLFDKDGKIIAGLRLGESRKSKSNLPAAMNGQYVRRDGDDTAYLIASPISITTGLSSWLDLNLVNVLPTAVHSIVQSKSDDTGQQLLFELVRTGSKDNSGMPQFTPKGGVPEGKTLQEPVVSQIRSGLENLRIADIVESNSALGNQLKLDFETLYRTTSGLVYRVRTGVLADKTYAKLTASFDPELVAQLKKEAEEAAAATPTPTATPTPAPESASSDAAASSSSASATPKPTASPKPPELSIASEDDAKKLNAQFDQWFYELPAYSARKFRYTFTDITEPPPPPPSAPSPGGSSGGSPFPAGMPFAPDHG